MDTVAYRRRRRKEVELISFRKRVEKNNKILDVLPNPNNQKNKNFLMFEVFSLRKLDEVSDKLFVLLFT